MNRRHFLKNSLATLSVLGFSKMIHARSIGAESKHSSAKGLFVVGSSLPGFAFDIYRSPYSVRFFNENFRFLDQVSIPRGSHPHGWMIDQADPNIIYGIKKYSRYAWAMNVVAPTQIRELRIPDQMSFSGHGAIAPDKSLLLSAFDFTASTASLLRYENSELIETIPVPSAGCHEFLFCPENPNTLILTNEFDANVKGLYRRNKNSLVWYDYKKRVIIKEVPSFLSQGPSHLTILRPGSNRILARGRHRVPALEVYENERVHLIECPTPHVQTNGEVEMLNAVLDPHDQEIAWATAPDYGLLMGVDLKSKKVIQTIYRDGILHVFAHRGELMVSVVNLSLGLSHITTLKNGQLQNSLGPFGDSSHMLFVSQS